MALFILTGSVCFALGQSGGLQTGKKEIGQSNTVEKVVSINFSKEEKKALRIEMIEMDITIRTIASMISLNKPDRLEVLFKRLTELQMAASVYHKKGISQVVKKWKKNDLMRHLENIQEESKAMTDFFHSINASEKKQDIQWSHVFEANRKILESCQKCHESSGVEMQ